MLCSDGDAAYELFACARAIPHYRLPKGGPRVIDTAFHIQTVNNLHGRFESFMRPFCGPATKNLPGYAAWLVARLIGNLLRRQPRRGGACSQHDQHIRQTPPII